MSNHQSQQVTLSLRAILHLAFGKELTGTRPLPDYETGLIINELVKDDLLFKVQFEHWDGTPLEYPVLWSYNEWYNSSTNYKKQKDRSEKERIAREIMKVNVKIVSRVLVNEYYYEQDQAEAKAYSMLAAKKFGNIRALGVSKLVTKEEELR